MKIFTFLICVFCFWCLLYDVGLSAPVGNPAGPVLLDGNYPTKFSLEAETVLERELKSSTSANPKFKGSFYTGKLSLYLGNRLDIYGLVGVYDGKVKNFISDNYIVVTRADVSYGAGISYILHEFEFLRGLFRLGVDAKYRRFEPEIDTVKEYRVEVSTTNEGLSFTEWQTSLGLSYQYKFFSPYIGVKYSDMDAHIKFTQAGTEHTDNNISSQDIWGLFYGIDILLGDNISFNIEARHLDEKAVNIGLSARF